MPKTETNKLTDIQIGFIEVLTTNNYKVEIDMHIIN